MSKLDYLIERLVEWYRGGKPGPDMVQIYPTNRCNLKCIFCAQRLNLYDLSKEVKHRRWLEITKEICGLGVREILISGGGEPLCVPKTVMKMMEIIKRANVEGRIITNGTLWTETLIKKTIEIGWDHVIFSVDGIGSTHDYLRGVKGTFNKILKNITIFRKLKKKLGSDKPFLEFTFVLNALNYKEVPKMIELANQLDVVHLNVEPVCVNNPFVEKIKMNVQMRNEFFTKILPIAEKLSKKLDITNNFESLKKVRIIEKTGKLRKLIMKGKSSDFWNLPCYEPWLWPKIEANGEVWPCSTVGLKENIKEKSFKEIWFGETFNNFRGRIVKGELPEACENCVLTHLVFSREISKKLKKRLKEFSDKKSSNTNNKTQH